MTDTAFPSIFVSHGAPTIADDGSAVHSFLGELGVSLGRPKAVLCVSAHWETRVPALGTAAVPQTIHDFHGFADRLYELRYPAPGSPELAERAGALIRAAGISCEESPAQGLDHGTWIPMMLMYPDADVPVVQLSVQPALGTAAHLRLGRALAPLRGEGVLVLGSGGAVHNLRYFRPGGTEVPTWARRFDDWLIGAVTAGAHSDIVDYRTRSDDGATAHPTDEHFLPLLVAMGAGGEGVKGRVIHQGFMDGALSMAAFSFG